MASKGLKHPMEPDSVPSVQPVSDTDDDLSSPESLLPMKPVEDDYSSDDEARKKKTMNSAKRQRTDSCGSIETFDSDVLSGSLEAGDARDLRRGCREFKPTYRESQKMTLAVHKNNHSSDIKAEQSYFYETVVFTKIDDEVLLEDKSLEECLTYLFKFSSSRFFDENRCTWNGAKLTDIINESSTSFQWFIENDNFNWKTTTPEKQLEAAEMWDYKLAYDHTDLAAEVAISTKKLHSELMKEGPLDLKTRSMRHEAIKACIESFASIISPLNYIQSGRCEQQFNVYVPPYLVPDDSPLIPEGREVVINNKPDGVFTFWFNKARLWLVPIEVYVPSEKEVAQHRFSPTAVPPQLGFVPVVPNAIYLQNAPEAVQRKDQILTSSAAMSSPVGSKGTMEVSSPRDPLPPKTSQNSLLNPEYVQAARTHIAESLPVHCRTPHCLDKMAGQHVQQLLATATQITTQQESFLEQGVLEILGLFVVNEYVYFSRLDMKKKLTYFLSGAFSSQINTQNSQISESDAAIRKVNLLKVYEELDPPSVSYSNFRLDLTIAKHRLALMIFMRRYIKTFHNLKI